MPTLMYGQIAPVTEHNRIAILALCVIAYCTCRVLQRKGEIGLGDVFRLKECFQKPMH